LLYVGFDKTAKITSEPKNTNKDQIENYFKEAEKFKEVVEIALTGQIPNFKKMEI